MRFALAVASLAFALSTTASADEFVVSQKERQFLIDGAKAEKLTVKAGDVVVFRNDDKVVHNVFSRTADQKFNLGNLRAGAEAKHTFAAPGSLDVECAVHPQMKFKVEIKP